MVQMAAIIHQVPASARVPLERNSFPTWSERFPQYRLIATRRRMFVEICYSDPMSPWL
jgi:hypothetical protein